ncbi:tautomerase family protein [Nocardia yamanashiensis]|uniref:tautomerase family protein n=1 Tax=Nocardia yamanashiensis TaxID=209247 RepID=UPI000832ACF6|nr:tautomerase family protein [Nocardia yamanashiensis]
MPLVRISLRDNLDPAHQRAIADAVHNALVTTIGIPPGDRFQVIEPRRPADLIFDPDYLGIERRDVIFLQITLVRGRPPELKQRLYRTIATELSAIGVRPEDIVITLTENDRADWSIGNGHAQLLDTELLARHGISPATPGAD